MHSEELGLWWLHVLLRNKWHYKYHGVFKRHSPLQLLQKQVIKLYIKKRTSSCRCFFYVLLSARPATLQKITVLLMQAKRGLQSGARKKCQTKGIYLVTRLLPLIIQHYCLYSVLPQLKTPWIKSKNKQRKWGNKQWESKWGHWGDDFVTAAGKRWIIK